MTYTVIPNTNPEIKLIGLATPYTIPVIAWRLKHMGDPEPVLISGVQPAGYTVAVMHEGGMVYSAALQAWFNDREEFDKKAPGLIKKAEKAAAKQRAKWAEEEAAR